MRFIIHADDFGLSKGITDSILDCYDHGALNSTSIMATGYAFDYAVAEYKKRPGLRMSIHLNLVDGIPVLPAYQLSTLVDRKGHFYHSFQSLWLMYLTKSKKGKEEMRTQIRLELAAQIRKAVSALGDDFQIHLDSHCHCHILPFVFDEIINLKKMFNIVYVRIPYERFFFCSNSWASFKNYFSINLLKHYVANVLVKRRKEVLAREGVQHNDFFIGVLFVTGMSYAVVKSALKKIKGEDGLVEVLFHPGAALANEKHLFRKVFAHNYTAAWQLQEQRTLKSERFAGLIANGDSLRYENISNSR